MTNPRHGCEGWTNNPDLAGHLDLSLAIRSVGAVFEKVLVVSAFHPALISKVEPTGLGIQSKRRTGFYCSSFPFPRNWPSFVGSALGESGIAVDFPLSKSKLIN